MSFDTENFIREIKSQRALWDLSSDDYSDRDVKKKIWEEITNKMCEDNLTEDEKREFGISLQHKWKNIRTCFGRELKRRTGNKSGSAASRRSPYKYFTQLQFLRETVPNNTAQLTIEEKDVPENNDDGGIVQKDSLIHKKKNEEHALVNVLRHSIVMREDREKNLESDSDRLFMLSLLTDFKKIPEDQRLSAKMDILDVLNRYQMTSLESPRLRFGLYRRGYSTRPEYAPETFSSRQYRHGHFTSVPKRQNTTEKFDEALSPTDTTVSDMSQDADLLELFN